MLIQLLHRLPRRSPDHALVSDSFAILIEDRSSESETGMKRLAHSESCQMQRVASLLGQALSLPVHPELIAMCSPIRAVRE